MRLLAMDSRLHRRSPAKSLTVLVSPAQARRPISSAGAAQAFEVWRTIRAPRRGEFVRILGEELRAAKDDLGRLVTLECGKIVSEGLGEVQDMI
jgi:aldehyde dehydrogenase (NAD+)